MENLFIINKQRAIHSALGDFPALKQGAQFGAPGFQIGPDGRRSTKQWAGSEDKKRSMGNTGRTGI